MLSNGISSKDRDIKRESIPCCARIWKNTVERLLDKAPTRGTAAMMIELTIIDFLNEGVKER
jgi:hypothetical protein